MAKTLAQLQELIAPAVEAAGLELYGCEFHPGVHQARLVVYIDSINGVTLDDCAKISRQLGAILDVEDPISGRYELEVSSPGLDRPLMTLPHFERVAGERVKVKLNRARNNQRNFVGVVKAVAGEEITLLLEDGSELVVPFNEIEKAKLISDI